MCISCRPCLNSNSMYLTLAPATILVVLGPNSGHQCETLQYLTLKTSGFTENLYMHFVASCAGPAAGCNKARLGRWALPGCDRAKAPATEWQPLPGCNRARLVVLENGPCAGTAQQAWCKHYAAPPSLSFSFGLVVIGPGWLY